MNSKLLVFSFIFMMAIASVYASTVSVYFEPGWNLVSVPFQVSNYSANAIWPSASGAIYNYTGFYNVANITKNGVGYWAKFNSPTTIIYSGSNITFLNISIQNKWNIVGSISDEVDPTTIVSIPSGIVTSQYFNYSNGYQVAHMLLPGRAYWVKANQAGLLQVGTPGIEPQAASLQYYLKISDSNKGYTQLYFGNAINPELPPKQTGFDARYTTENYIESFPTSGYKDYTVAITSSAYPVKITLNTPNNYLYSMRYVSSGMTIAKSLKNTETFYITDPAIKNVVIRVTVPITKILLQ